MRGRRCCRTRVIHFTDPTKIPLEIVIAAAESAEGKLVTIVDDLEEAAIVLDVLENGSDGVLFRPAAPTTCSRWSGCWRRRHPNWSCPPSPWSIEHVGLGDRVCVDTCSHFEEDEGILVGSYSSGFVLCCSETHPLPYMPTRPFRVNAGALHSYTLGPDNRTNYLSELRLGQRAARGQRRRAAPGGSSSAGRSSSRGRCWRSDPRRGRPAVSLTVQDDWHVRVLGPGGKVLNVTELQTGDELLGYLAADQRHVGCPSASSARRYEVRWANSSPASTWTPAQILTRISTRISPPWCSGCSTRGTTGCRI